MDIREFFPSDTPPAVTAALDHVRARFPDVTNVTFSVDPDGFYVWVYQTQTGETPAFGAAEINLDLLEAALDAAFEHATFPTTYHAK